MKAYRKQSGVYIELDESIPVSDTYVEVARRPSPDHVFQDTWADGPLDPAVCWRLRTATERTAQQDRDLQAFLDSTGGKVVKALATALIAKGVVTLAEIRAEYRKL